MPTRLRKRPREGSPERRPRKRLVTDSPKEHPREQPRVDSSEKILYLCASCRVSLDDGPAFIPQVFTYWEPRYQNRPKAYFLVYCDLCAFELNEETRKIYNIYCQICGDYSERYLLTLCGSFGVIIYWSFLILLGHVYCEKDSVEMRRDRPGFERVRTCPCCRSIVPWVIGCIGIQLDSAQSHKEGRGRSTIGTFFKMDVE